MNKRIRISMAILVAVAVASVGVASFACGGRSAATAQAVPSFARSGNAACPYAGSCPAMSQCPYLMKQQQETSAGLETVCGSSTSAAVYAANIFDIHDGHSYAVCHDKVFEVTASTPYVDLGNARYYVNSGCLARALQDHPEAIVPELDREAVALATVDGNVVGTENGQKLARCLSTGEVFLVKADSPAKVMDGKRYYLNEAVDLASMNSTMHK